jgi:translation initiation factor 2B subunit (eIF-2B alpha/beta/delta family)
MTYINLYSAISETLLARPLYGQNPNLTYIEDGGFISNSFMDNVATNMRSLTKLTTFKVQNNSNILTATVNKILNELLLAKQGGGVLTSVFITGNAPTGQGLSDKATLQALGVAVTTS